MRIRLGHALAAASLGLVALTGCSTDEPEASDPVTSTEPSVEASEPIDIPSELESLIPSDLPTDIPTDLPTDVDLGDDCPEINKVLSDSMAGMQEMMTDPTGAVGLFSQLATDLRAAAADSDDDVAAAAEQLAGIYDQLGTALETGEIPDANVITQMQEAATALTTACSS